MKDLANSDCQVCGGTGWTRVTKGGLEAVSRCPECHAQKDRETRLSRAGIPPRYGSLGFEEFKVVSARAHSRGHALQQQALKRSIDFVEAFPDLSRGLLLVGPCGVGKTHLSVAILRAVIVEKGVTGLFVDETELLRRLQYSYSPGAEETEREVLVPLMEADLLIWDDLGTGRPTEWVRETIRTVINHRYTHNRPTIFSTNWPMNPPATRSAASSSGEESLSERIGQRLFSRIMEMCEVLEMDGPDFRTAIRKAGHDFRQGAGGPVLKEKERREVPAELLECPNCRSREVIQEDFSKLQGSAERQVRKVSCRCRRCDRLFVVEHHVNQARVEYLDHL